MKKLLSNRFWGKGIYLLDEPEAGLSFESLLEMMILFDELRQQQSTINCCDTLTVIDNVSQCEYF